MYLLAFVTSRDRLRQPRSAPRLLEETEMTTAVAAEETDLVRLTIDEVMTETAEVEVETTTIETDEEARLVMIEMIDEEAGTGTIGMTGDSPEGPLLPSIAGTEALRTTDTERGRDTVTRLKTISTLTKSAMDWAKKQEIKWFCQLCELVHVCYRLKCNERNQSTISMPGSPPYRVRQCVSAPVTSVSTKQSGSSNLCLICFLLLYHNLDDAF